MDCEYTASNFTDTILVADDDKQTKYEEKKALVEEEVKRMSLLPPRSTYVAHRMRVLTKVLQLLSIQRSASDDVELELLFSGLSL